MFPGLASSTLYQETPCNLEASLFTTPHLHGCHGVLVIGLPQVAQFVCLLDVMEQLHIRRAEPEVTVCWLPVPPRTPCLLVVRLDGERGPVVDDTAAVRWERLCTMSKTYRDSFKIAVCMTLQAPAGTSQTDGYAGIHIFYVVLYRVVLSCVELC